MTHITASESARTTLPRLDDEGRAILFTSARTANTFSARPVGEGQLREIYELMKWGRPGPTRSRSGSST
jgi:3-hydroxypropanoate dehydrogenase